MPVPRYFHGPRVQHLHENYFEWWMRLSSGMARTARAAASGIPNYITQRWNHLKATFFCEEDYWAYLEIMARWCGHCGVEILAYCPMLNHVYLIN